MSDNQKNKKNNNLKKYINTNAQSTDRLYDSILRKQSMKYNAQKHLQNVMLRDKAKAGAGEGPSCTSVP